MKCPDTIVNFAADYAFDSWNC